MTNPNIPPTPNHLTPEEQLKKDAMERAFSFVGVKGIEDLREAQWQLVADKHKGIPLFHRAAHDKAQKLAYAEFDSLIDKHLEVAGISDGSHGRVDPNRDAYRRVLRDHSIDKKGDQAWEIGFADPITGNRVSDRDKLEVSFDQFINDMMADLPATPNTLSPSPELLQARDDLVRLQEKLAQLSAKRMGRLISRGKTKKEFEQLQQKYHDKLIEVGQKEEELREQNNPARTDDEKRFDVMMDLLGHEKDLRELTNNKLEGSKLDKLAHWLNDGGKWKKILKGAAVAVPLGLVTGGAGVVVAAVLTGVGLISAGAGTVTGVAIWGGGGKLLLNFIRKNTDRRIDVNAADDREAQAALGNIEDVDTKTHAEIQNKVVTERGAELRTDVKEQQKRRRRTLGKAAVITAATIGISTSVSTALQSLFDEVAPVFQEKDYGGKSGQTSNGSGHEYGQNSTKFGSGGSNGTAAGEAASGAEVHPHPDHDPKYGGSETHPRTDHDSQHIDEEEASPTETPTVKYSPEAQAIHGGEGLFSVFDQMGVPRADQPELLQKAGPKLANLYDSNGRPFAYLINGEQGNWGIRMTPDGKMPAGTLDMIQQTHQEMIGARAPEVTPPLSIEKIDVITPDEFADNPALDELTNITVEDGRAYAEGLGFNPDAWDMVQHQMINDYPDSFEQLGGGRVGINTDALQDGKLPDEVAAALFNRLENINLPSGDSINALEKIETGDINKSLLDFFTLVPEFTESAEELMRKNGLGHAWLEINKPEIASEIAKAAPDAFTFEDKALGIIPNGRITDEAWAIIANHMNAVERARVGYWLI